MSTLIASLFSFYEPIGKLFRKIREKCVSSPGLTDVVFGIISFLKGVSSVDLCVPGYIVIYH